MKVEQANVNMSASHDYSYESESEAATNFRAIFSEASQGSSATSAATGSGQEDERVRMLLLLQRLISQMLEIISGNKSGASSDLSNLIQNQTAETSTLPVAGSGRTATMEWNTVLTETVREHESTDFSATGTVRTADGRSIDFTMGLGMCRDYSCTRTLQQSGSMELHDPLVINFNGSAAELTGQRFAFDLDVDGVDEMIPGLAAGSAWLAFDANGDGKINDGSELFGTSSGDGFADLARLDSDGNHWLDEGDTAFSSLCLWQRDSNGTDSLTSLSDKGVGAIYLGATQTPFSITDNDNQKLGYIRSSGVYLSEDGHAGTVQQVDLAV